MEVITRFWKLARWSKIIYLKQNLEETFNQHSVKNCILSSRIVCGVDKLLTHKIHIFNVIQNTSALFLEKK